MIREALVSADAVFGAADRPPENHAQHHLGVGDAESDDRAAAHTATQKMRGLEIRVLGRSSPLSDVVRPGYALDPAARLAGLAPVEDDAAVFFRQVIEQLDAGVHALRLPL